MKSRVGFSIIECMVYCSLACLLCWLIFSWVGASQSFLGRINKKSKALLDLYGSVDVFARDIMEAPSNKDFWKMRDKHELVWHTAQEDLGWIWRDGSLYRVSGHYRDGKWTGSTKSLVHNYLKNVEFKVGTNNHEEIDRIVVSMDYLQSTIYLRNRSIHASIP